MEIDLNTRDTDEYRQWLALLKEIKSIHQTLQNEPNAKGLKMARSIAYNILADIHELLDQSDTKEHQSDASQETFSGLKLN